MGPIEPTVNKMDLPRIGRTDKLLMYVPANIMPIGHTGKVNNVIFLKTESFKLINTYSLFPCCLMYMM